MAAAAASITVAGNVVDDPELKYTPSGVAVAKFRIASTPRYMDRQTSEWKDGESLFLSVNCWRLMAECVAESLTKGTRVLVQGRLKQRSYETKEGEKRTVYEVECEDIGPSLQRATVKITKSQRSGDGYGGKTAAGAPGGAGSDPWASDTRASSGGGFSDEPPF